MHNSQTLETTPMEFSNMWPLNNVKYKKVLKSKTKYKKTIFKKPNQTKNLGFTCPYTINCGTDIKFL